jgi:hypothetical protein
MPSITSQPLPERSLLNPYARKGAHTDCYVAEISGMARCAHYVEAFYTTPLFKLERCILKLALSLPSTDAQVRKLIDGSSDVFAAWRVESRTDDQLLMCDKYGNTRSWLMVEPAAASDPARTRLYFGSAVTKSAMARPTFRMLLGFHSMYSKALLAAACRRLERHSG